MISKAFLITVVPHAAAKVFFFIDKEDGIDPFSTENILTQPS